MDAGVRDLFVTLLIGYAVGSTLVAALTRGRSRETIVVVPDPSEINQRNSGCGLLGLLVIAGIVAVILFGAA